MSDHADRDHCAHAPEHAAAPLPSRLPTCATCPVKEQALCRGVPIGDLERLFGYGQRVFARKAGSTLFEQGEAFEHVLIVQSGWALVYKLFEDGRRQIIRFALPGDLLGFEGDDTVGMLYTAEALTDIRVCAIRREPFCRACQNSPLFSLNVARSLAHEMLAAWNHMGALGQQTAQARIASLLLDLHRRVEARQGRHKVTVPIPLNQVLIADATGLTSVHVCRTLKQMRLDGLLEFARGELLVLDGDRLNAMAQLDPDVSPAMVAGTGAPHDRSHGRSRVLA
ncbi:MAG TPA: Crp/Fnr family transcriptional regulator [Azospirillum sp.]